MMVLSNSTIPSFCDVVDVMKEGEVIVLILYIYSEK